MALTGAARRGAGNAGALHSSCLKQRRLSTAYKARLDAGWAVVERFAKAEGFYLGDLGASPRATEAFLVRLVNGL